MQVAILGWGSLLWDPRPSFDQQHLDWAFDGPTLPIEFSRVSESRDGALTLVVDAEHGAQVQVAWCLSARSSITEAVSDLKGREGCSESHIGVCQLASAESAASAAEMAVRAWAIDSQLDAIIWTSLPSNFAQKVRAPFSVPNALTYLNELGPSGKTRAREYILRAPQFVTTPLRTAVLSEPWFTATD